MLLSMRFMLLCVGIMRGLQNSHILPFGWVSSLTCDIDTTRKESDSPVVLDKPRELLTPVCFCFCNLFYSFFLWIKWCMLKTNVNFFLLCFLPGWFHV